MKTVLFDLDGTLTDSGEGIINCAWLALEYFGIPLPSREEMRVFVGPPLRDSFLRFGVPEDGVEKAIEIYRSRYVPTGMFENSPYPGIVDLLTALRKKGFRLYVATSKPEGMATAILEKFNLAKYFDLICGASMDDTRDSKDKVIAYLIGKAGDENTQGFIAVLAEMYAETVQTLTDSKNADEGNAAVWKVQKG
jgi:phosphoglycolate phosphatase